MNVILLGKFIPAEIKRALDSIEDLKAPNGMPAIFYKKNVGTLWSREKLKKF
jgi:hypothetical protein